MKSILIPTDFSSNAKNALNYAVELSKKDPAKLILLNVYHVDLAGQEDPNKDVAAEFANAKKVSEDKLRYLCNNIANNTGIHCEFVCKEGFVPAVIINAIKENQYDLVIMGTKGANNFVGSILGSNTARVIDAAVCPVIAIPEGAPFVPIKKITYATAYHHSDIRILKKLVEIARVFKAQVNVLHVPEKGESPKVSKNGMQAFMNSVESKIDYQNISYQIFDGDDTESALENYIEAESTNMLVMSTHHRSFFDKIFGKSVTKRFALHTSIPLMAFHYNSKSAVKVF